MNRLITILLLFIGFAASAQNPYISRYDRFVAIDTTTLNFPANTGGFYYNQATGFMMWKDADGYHKMRTVSGSGGGTIVGVNGTTNRITASGTTTRTLDISATFEALLGKVGTGLGQFASTTSTDLRTVLSDEVGTGNFYTTGGALGTPASGTATNLTGLPSTGITPFTSSALNTLVTDNVGSGALYLGQPIEAHTTATSDYTLILGNVTDYSNSGILRITGAGDKDITIPTNASVALPLYSKLSIVNEGADTVRLIAAGGVTLINDDIEIAPNESGFLYQSAANNWIAFGGGSSGGGGGGISNCFTSFIEKTASYTLTLADVSACNNSVIAILTPTTDIDFTFPLHSSVAWEDGTTVSLYNASVDDTVTVVLPGGITPSGQTNLEIPPKGALTLVSPSADVVHAVGNQAGGSGGGATITGATNELVMVSGANGVASGLYADATGNMNMGTGLSGSDRYIQAAGSASNIGMMMYGKGTGYAGMTGGGNSVIAKSTGVDIGGPVSLGLANPGHGGMLSGLFFYNNNTTVTAPTNGARLYAKDDGAGVAQLYAMSESGATEYQLTPTWADWTPTYVGFTGSVTGTARYRLVGKTLYFELYVSGTSNAAGTTWTFTLPLSLTANGLQVVPAICINGGAGVVGYISTTASSNIMSVYNGVAGSAWSSTLAKGARVNGFIEVQ